MLLPIAPLLLQVAAAPAAPTHAFATPEELTEIRAVMDGIYAAVSHEPGQQPDWEAYHEVFHPGATMVLPVGPGQYPKTQTVEQFLAFYKGYLAQPGAVDEGFVERCAGLEATVFGNVATVTSVYEARKTVDQEKPDRVGIDCVQMMRTQDGWIAVSLVTDYERADNPLPARLAAFTRPFEREAAAQVALEEQFQTLKQTDSNWITLLKRKAFVVGAYRVPAQGTDHQSPHEQDEIYFVTGGKAKFTVDGETMAVKPGDVLFVAAQAEHRFHDVEEDLRLLVLFAN